MNRTVFIFLTLFSILLCLAGMVRYERCVSCAHLQRAAVTPAPQNAMGLEFYRDYDQARQIALEQHKPMLLFFTTPTCVFSKRMSESVFQDPEIHNLLEQFVLVKADLSENETLWSDFHVKSSPTIQFISSNGVLLRRINGETKAEQLSNQLNTTLQSLSALKNTNSVVR